MTAEHGRFFLPGPTEVHPDVLDALRRPMIGHRSPAMVDLLRQIQPALRALFRTTRPVMVGTCSATGFMEMAVRSGVRQRVLSLVGGAFGLRFAKIAKACGRQVVQLEVPYGQTIEPDMLRDALVRSHVDAVTLVHSETSTGALAPLEELAAVIGEFEGVVSLVDAVTSLGGSPVETDRWNLDFVLTGSQKALALPPGLAFGVASERMVDRAKRVVERGVYLDLLSQMEAAEQHRPVNTPALSLFYALERQLQRIAAEGGIEARWARHREMLDTVQRWIQEKGVALGVEYLPEEHRRSWTVSCLSLLGDQTGTDVTNRVARAGWTIGAGYGTLKDSSIRIGHMGDHTIVRLQELLAVVEEAIACHTS